MLSYRYLLLGCDVLVSSQFHYTTSERRYFILEAKKSRNYAGFGVSQTPRYRKFKRGRFLGPCKRKGTGFGRSAFNACGYRFHKVQRIQSDDYCGSIIRIILYEKSVTSKHIPLKQIEQGIFSPLDFHTPSLYHEMFLHRRF